jgi:hypothetical protein
MIAHEEEGALPPAPIEENLRNIVAVLLLTFVIVALVG